MRILVRGILLIACYLVFRSIGSDIRTALLLCLFVVAYVSARRLALLVRRAHGGVMSILVAAGFVPIGLLILNLADRSRAEARTTATFAGALLVASAMRQPQPESNDILDPACENTRFKMTYEHLYSRTGSQSRRSRPD